MSHKAKHSLMLILCLVVVIQLSVWIQSVLRDNSNNRRADIDQVFFIDEGSGTVVTNPSDIGEPQYDHVPIGLLLGSGYTDTRDPNRDREHHDDIPCTGLLLSGGCIPQPIGVNEEPVTGTNSDIEGCVSIANSNREYSTIGEYHTIVENTIPCTGGLTPPLGVDEEPVTGTHTDTTGDVFKPIEDPTTGSLQDPVDDPTPIDKPGDTPRLDHNPITPSDPSGGGGGGGGGGLVRDNCVVDLSPSYYDNTCDTPIASKQTIVINTITPVITTPVQCYYSDGQFVVNSYLDIAGSLYRNFIIMTIRDCLVHGIADTQRYYHPEQYITQGEVLKMIVRKEKLLSPSFNHFTRKEKYTYRWTPYLSIAQRKGMMKNISSDRSDMTMYNKAQYNDIMNLLGHRNNDKKSRFVSRGEFASLLYQ